MPEYLTYSEVWKTLWPILIIVFALALAITFLAGRYGQRRELFLVVLAFSMLGIVTGYIGGFSRAPAIGTVLPAVLSLMGGLVVYLVGKEISSRLFVVMSMFAFALTFLIGTQWGAIMRNFGEEYKFSEQYLKQQAFTEFKVNEFRKNMDLPPLQPGANIRK